MNVMCNSLKKVFPLLFFSIKFEKVQCDSGHTALTVEMNTGRKSSTAHCEPLTFIYHSEWGHQSSSGSPTLPAIFYLPRTKSFCKITTVYETQWPPDLIYWPTTAEFNWASKRFVNGIKHPWMLHVSLWYPVISADLDSCSSIIRQRFLPSQQSEKSTCELWRNHKHCVNMS